LGAGTALISEKAAMACTAAVEEVIEEHYQKQADKLGDDDPGLTRVIEKFKAEEAHHRHTALAHGAEETPGYRVLSGGIKAGTRLAIWLSERI
jgi:ubiquinone biosynthesis monooxygenase Coq7